ncbi:hypothetical protein KY332_04830 [Candidatus Woesearchaeota archaeon]|nr:hypothetical protein [Candidatus Woesearchaeota archaeon]
MFRIAEVSVRDGKGDWVKERQEDGSFEQVCLCVHNIDLSHGCISEGCLYCYAGYKNKGDTTPTPLNPAKIEKELAKRFEETGIPYVRFGKLTDPGHPLYRKNLIATMEILKKLGGHAIVITKFLEFDETLAKLSIETNSVLCASLGPNDLEPPAYKMGYDNEFRASNIIKYHKYGVNAVQKLVGDLTVSPEEADAFCNGGAQLAIYNMEKYGIHTTLLPIRIKAKEVAFKLTGVDWDVLKDQTGRRYLDPNEDRRAGSYIIEEKVPPDIIERIESDRPTRKHEKKLVTYIIPTRIHPSYSQFEENAWICGKIGDIWSGYEYCDKCHIKDLEGRLLEPVKFPQHKLPYVDTSDVRESKRRAQQRKRARQKAKQQTKGTQLKFFEEDGLF